MESTAGPALVIIAGLEEGLFPHESSSRELDGVDEERRLMYVGITRAQERLYLCHAWSRTIFGQTQFNPPSRFLNELPEELIQLREGGGPTSAPQGIPKREPVSIAAGDTVVHDKWGEGVVVNVEGGGGDALATIRFDEVGEKRLLLGYAPLKKVGG